MYRHVSPKYNTHHIPKTQCYAKSFRSVPDAEFDTIEHMTSAEITVEAQDTASLSYWVTLGEGERWV